MEDFMDLVDRMAYELLMVEKPEAIDLILDLIDKGVSPEKIEKRLMSQFSNSAYAANIVCAYYHLARIRTLQNENK